MRLLLLTAALIGTLTSGAQTPCENGFAAGYPCDLVDLMGFVPSSNLGGGDAEDLWGWTDPLDGSEYAIVGMAGTTAFVDVTAPTSPVVVGLLPSHTGSSLWRDVKVYNNHAYIVSEATGHGSAGVRPDAPAQTCRIRRHHLHRGRPLCRVWQRPQHRHQRSRAAGLMRWAANTFSGGLHILDISVSNPTTPSLIGSFAEDGYTHDAQIVNYERPGCRPTWARKFALRFQRKHRGHRGCHGRHRRP